MSANHTELDQYLYQLPEERIAKHPLSNRDDSKLMIYKNGDISHQAFKNVITHVPDNATIFLNNTKVIAARLFFQKSTGAKIEVFLTEPIAPHTEFQQALKVQHQSTWKCMIGGLKKWKDQTEIYLTLGKIELTATLIDRANCHVQFSWNTDDEFLAIIEAAGHTPLPPYLNREEETEDKERYQTVFSEKEGAVAAPTAGLHFTDEILADLANKNCNIDRVTLHVSAGTFRPIKDDDFSKHDMHNERIIIHRYNIESILSTKGPIMAVGTTALRTLESTYWYGVLLTQDPNAAFFIEKDTPYQTEPTELRAAMQAILDKMDTIQTDVLKGETEIFVYPGYEFKVVEGLFTNFHMSASTLVLLVAAFVGPDWKELYTQALNNDYRFLSYGDTSLLWR
ncbi:MAG: S-adenosylmethionine:tRNA ribosyltransferase-isomerase [Reichenbachiella sp.]